jgi:hypothetical protein
MFARAGIPSDLERGRRRDEGPGAYRRDHPVPPAPSRPCRSLLCPSPWEGLARGVVRIAATGIGPNRADRTRAGAGGEAEATSPGMPAGGVVHRR